ncbi:MAG TPA: DUF4386 family protein [Candidatus Aquicultor sp.]|jgi:hypothetical protein
MNEPTAKTTDFALRTLYKIGGVVALSMLALIPSQMVIFIAWPPPSTVIGYFTLFQKNWLLGLLNLDFLYILTNVLLVLIYLALYAALKRANESLMAIALTFGLVGIAAYFASNTAFEMLSLSSQYAAAATEAQRAMFLAAGQAMLAIYRGTAFDVYYDLNAVTTLVISAVMLRSNIFSRATAYAGIVTGIFMIIPSTAGTIGLYLAVLSLVPFAVWMVLIARRLFRLAHDVSQEA